MSVLQGALTVGFGGAVSRLVGRLIAALGIGFLAYQGADTVVNLVANYLDQLLGGIDPLYQQAWTAFGFDIALNMLMAAYTTRVALRATKRLAFGLGGDE